MEPLLITGSSLHRGILTDLTLDLAQKSAGLVRVHGYGSLFRRRWQRDGCPASFPRNLSDREITATVTSAEAVAGLPYPECIRSGGSHSGIMVWLEEVTIIKAPLARCFDLARSVEVHLAGNTHFGEQAVAAAGVTSGLIGLGQRVTWRAKHFYLWHTLTSEITALRPPVYFQDTMIRGPFRSMKHDHYFRTLTSGETEMRDVFYFAAPWPVVGFLAEKLMLQSYMKKLLQERNVALKQIAESPDWPRWLHSAD